MIRNHWRDNEFRPTYKEVSISIRKNSIFKMSNLDSKHEEIMCGKKETDENDTFIFSVSSPLSGRVSAHTILLNSSQKFGDLAFQIKDKFGGNCNIYIVNEKGRVDITSIFSYVDTIGKVFGRMDKGNHFKLVVMYYDVRSNPLFTLEHVCNAMESNLPWPPRNVDEPFNGGPIGIWKGWGHGPTVVSDEINNTPRNLFGLRGENGDITLYNVVQLHMAFGRGDMDAHPHVKDEVSLSVETLKTVASTKIPVVDQLTGESVGYY